MNNSKAYQIDEVAKAIDGVSEEAVKSVSNSNSKQSLQKANILYQAAKTLLENKASVSSVGDLFVLPYAEELGLKV